MSWDDPDEEGLGLPVYNRRDGWAKYVEKCKEYIRSKRFSDPYKEAKECEAAIWVYFIKHLQLGRTPISFVLRNQETRKVIATPSIIDRLMRDQGEMYSLCAEYIKCSVEVCRAKIEERLVYLIQNSKTDDVAKFIKTHFADGATVLESFREHITETLGIVRSLPNTKK